MIGQGRVGSIESQVSTNLSKSRSYEVKWRERKRVRAENGGGTSVRTNIHKRTHVDTRTGRNYNTKKHENRQEREP